MTATTVDVLLPTLGRPAALEAAIRSVEEVRAAEPDVDLRLHVVDEADGSAAGAAAARNLAARRGDAEFIALLDDDDRWLDRRLGQAAAILRGDARIVVVAGDAQLASGGRFLRCPPGPDGELRDHGGLALSCDVCTSTVTVRRADWEAVGGMDESMDRAEDYELWLRLTRSGRRVHLLPGVMAWHDDLGDGLASDPVAMARATLRALEASAAMPEGEVAWRDRRGRLKAVVAHGLAREGDSAAARREALEALGLAPSARVAWTAAVRALLSLRR